MTLDETPFERLVTPPERPRERRFLTAAIAVSLALHALVALALIDRIRKHLEDTEEAAVMVQLVPPPEPEELEPEEPEPEPEPETAPEPEPEPAEVEEPAPEPEDPAASGEQAAEAPPLPVMRPVVEFGETDSGARVSPDGSAAEEPEEPEPEEPTPPEPEIAEAEEEQSADSEVLAVLLNDAEEAAVQEDPADEPLTQAEQLYSQSILGDERTRTAINGMPRDQRAGELCMTEMRAQLRAANRPAQILPAYRLPAGTVLAVHRAGFRSQGLWYDLAFRCEVDDGVTKVMKFSYRIGDPVPRSQWAQRGFPLN